MVGYYVIIKKEEFVYELGLSTNCYQCPNLPICPDIKRVEQVIYDIHQDPTHQHIGGYGNITVSCSKKESLMGPSTMTNKEEEL